MKIIINGMHRSGTVLLSRLINALPDTHIVIDGLSLPWMYHRVETQDFIYPKGFYEGYEVDFNKGTRLSSSEVQHSISVAKFIYKEEMERLGICGLEIMDKDSYVEIYNKFIKSVRKAKGVSIVGTKNSHLFPYRDAMLDNFDDLHWIDIIRDPRGWYCSAMVSHPQNLLRAALLYRKAMKSITPSRRWQGRYLRVQYEELVMFPMAVMSQVCHLLNTPMVNYQWFKGLKLTGNDGSAWNANSSYTAEGEPTKFYEKKATGYEVIDPRPAFRWQEKLNFAEKAIIKLITGVRGG